MIGPILFVDPVSFLLHLPEVAYNFVTFSLYELTVSANLDILALPEADAR
jgi:hypothetical protein